MSRKRKIVISIGFIALFIFFWFYRINSPFSTQTSHLESFDYRGRTLDEYRFANSCTGFEGVCDLQTLRLRLEIAFQGFKWEKPYPQFLNISGFGAHRGWTFEPTYFGWRELRVLDSSKKELSRFSQFLWNTNAYGDFSQVIAFDVFGRRLFVSPHAFGFVADTEQGWVVHY